MNALTARDGGGLAVIRGWNGPVDRGIHVHSVLVTETATDHAACFGCATRQAPAN